MRVREEGEGKAQAQSLFGVVCYSCPIVSFFVLTVDKGRRTVADCEGSAQGRGSEKPSEKQPLQHRGFALESLYGHT